MSSPTLTKVTINSTDVTSHLINWKETTPDANINQFVVALEKGVYDTESMIRDDPYGTEVLIQRGSLLSTEQNIIRGIILTRETVGQLVTIKVADNLAITKKKKITRTFSSNVDVEEGVISEIFKTLINDYTDLTADDTSVTNSGTDVIVKRLVANNVSVYKMLQDLAELLNWQFFYDSATDKVYFQPKGTRGSSTTLTVGDNIVQRPIWQRDGNSKIRVLTVQGGPTETGTVQNFNGDGSEQEFTLAHTPVTINSIYVNSVLQAGGTEGQTLDADYFVDYANKMIKFSDGSVPGAGSGNIIVDYTYLSPITITGENNIPEGEEITDRRPNLLTVTDVQTYLENKLERYSEDFLKARILVNQISGAERGQTVHIIDTNEAIEDDFIVTDIRREFPYKYDVLEVTTEPLDFDDDFANLEDRVRRIEERLIQEEDLVIILKQGSRFFKIGRRWMKVEKRNIAGENGIYGNPDFGIYGVSKYGDEQSFGFVLGNSKGGILGTSILGSNVSDAVLKFMQQGGDYYFEDFIDDDFKDSSTTADWTGGSISFDAEEIASSKTIDYNHGTITAAKLTATEVSGDFAYFMSADGNSTQFNTGDLTDTTFVAGTVGDYALSFNGSTSKVVTANANESLSLPIMTVSAWIKTSSNGEVIYKNRNGASSDNSDNYNIGVNSSGKVSFHCERASDGAYFSATGTTDVRDDQWHHIAGSFDGQFLKVYVDGILEDTEDSGSVWTPYMGPGGLEIGSNDISDHGTITYFTGYIDEVRVYNRVLLQSEITTLAARGNVSSGIVGKWSFEEGSGDYAFDTSNWERVESGISHTFLNSGTDLKWRAAEKAGSTGEISQIVVEDYH